MTDRIFSLMTALSLLCMSSYGQRSDIIGEVFNTGNTPVAGASVSLLQDSTIMQTSLTNDSGSFAFTGLRSGSYLLSVTAVGYARLFSGIIQLDSLRPSVDIRLIAKPESILLQGVSVIANKRFIEQKIDRTIMNVDALVGNAGGTALDVLENAPGVVVSAEGAVSLKGKSGVVIFIDDKPTYLSGTALANYLKSLPSGTLDKIEIMPNPPARYDAAGNAGVINIRTKKNRSGGFNGGINLSASQGRYFRTNNSFNFNYKTRKFNVFGTASYAVNTGFNDLDIYRYYYKESGALQSGFSQKSFILQTIYNTSLKLGVDYFLNSKTNLGVLIDGSQSPVHARTTNKSIVSNGAGDVDSLIDADNKEDIHRKKTSMNLNYLHRYNEHKELSFDVDYITYRDDEEQLFLNTVFGPSGNRSSTDALTGSLPSTIHIYSAKGDYVQSIGSETSVSAGAKLSYVNTNNAADYFSIVDTEIKPDYDKTNHFLYKELINAAYLNVNKNWKRLSIQAGLRLENTISDGHQLGNIAKPDSAFRRMYTNLFPTVYFLYKLDTFLNNQISFSYGRRIDRPFYEDLNPFISPLDKYSFYVGNPYLQPTFTNTFELSYIFKSKITTTIFYNATRDIIEETVDLASNIFISRPANIGKSAVIGLSVNGSLKPVNWWTSNLYAEVQKRNYQGIVYGYHLDTSSVYFGANCTNQFALGKGWIAELSGNYKSSILSGQIISGATGRVNVGASKKILGNKGSLKVNVRDIFRTALNHGIITSIANAYATYRNRGDTRIFSISFNCNFGRSGGSPKTRRSGAESEQSRVKE